MVEIPEIILPQRIESAHLLPGLEFLNEVDSDMGFRGEPSVADILAVRPKKPDVTGMVLSKESAWRRDIKDVQNLWHLS